MKPASNAHALAAVLLACLFATAGCNSDSPQSLIASGKEYQASNDHKAAVIQFKSALQADPDSAEARVLLGQALLDSGDPAGATLELTKVVDDKASRELALPLLARALLVTGNQQKLTTSYGDIDLEDKAAAASLKSSLATAWGLQGNREMADKALAAALAAKPDFGPALLLSARRAAVNGDTDAALRLIDEVLARDGSLYEGWQLKGEILLYVKNDAKAAEAAFRSALVAEKTYVPAHIALISMRMREDDIPGMQVLADEMRAVLPQHPQTLFVDAQVAYQRRDIAKARELVQLLLRGAPNHVGVLQLAGAIEAQGGSLTVAERHLAKALAIEPDLRPARESLARIYLRLAQPIKVMEVLQPLMGNNSPKEVYALVGEAQLMLGDTRAAEEAFTRAATIDPDDPRVRTALALTHLSRGEVDSAFAELESVAASNQDTLADMAIVSARLMRNEFKAALRAVDAMEKKQPANPDVTNLRGRVYLAAKDWPAARTAFDETLKLDPANFAAVSNLAAIDVLEKKPEAAQKRLEASIAADPGNVYAHMALTQLRSLAGASPEELRRLLNAAIQAAPGNPEPRLQLIAMLGRQRQFKDALVAAQEAAAALPDDTRVLDALGIAQMQAGDTQQALTTFRRIAGIDAKSAKPFLRLADVYKATNATDAVEISLKRAVELEPGMEVAQVALMDFLLAQNRANDALDIARRFQRHRPTEAAGYLFEGGIHRRGSATDAAVAAYRNGLAKAGPHSDLAVALHRTLVVGDRGAEADRFAAAWLKDHPGDAAFEYELAVTSIGRGNLPQAQARLERVLAIRPNHPLALNNLAWVLVMQGKPGAVAYAQRAVDRMPGQAALIDTLAMSLAADKQADQALVLQKQAVELAPDDLDLRLNLAKIALQAGDKDLARKELERLQTVGKDFPLQAEVTRLMKTL